jgi:dipeptidyl-peptidase-4
MMKTRVLVVLLLAVANLASAQEKQPLSLEAIFGPGTDWEGGSLQNLTWVDEGSAFLYLDLDPDGRTKNVYRQRVEDGERSLVIEGKSLALRPGDAPIPMDGYQASRDGRYFLIASARKGSSASEGGYFIHDTVTRELTPLSAKGGGQRHAKLSPDAARVGFVRNGNLFVVERESGAETQLTFDDGEDISNGINKGFGSDGWRWSPDGQRIAFLRADQRGVGSVPLIDYLTAYPKVDWTRYPKAGDSNWKLRVGVIHVETGRTTWLELGGDTDQYFPRMKWTRDPRLLAVERLNRRQNQLDLLFADVETGAARVILTETDPYWVRIDDDLTFFTTRDEFLWTSQRSGYKHAYLYDYGGRLLKQITAGEWEMSAARAPHAVLGIDEKDGWLYFLSNKDAIVEQHIYRVRLDGSRLERLTEEPGWHVASLSPDAAHFVTTFSRMNTPPQNSLHRSDGSRLRWVSRGELPGLARFTMTEPEFLTVRTSDGESLNAMMIKPAAFQASEKYPVILYAYGGVSSQTVVDRWDGDRRLWHQWMTEQGYIIFTIDNRGTGGRGKAFENFMYQNLGTWPLRDHIEAAKYLASLPYVDASRIGIWGWSAGGYLTCLALTEGSDYFSVGVSVAPVTNYRFYSSSWAERYMGPPRGNEAAYDREAVATYAHKLKGHLLLVHGIADDNVQLQNTVEVVKAFQAANKQFDLMLYPGLDHSLLRGGDTQLHVYTLITEYFLRHLPAGRFQTATRVSP